MNLQVGKVGTGEGVKILPGRSLDGDSPEISFMKMRIILVNTFSRVF
jgi:hypothetical protein